MANYSSRKGDPNYKPMGQFIHDGETPICTVRGHAVHKVTVGDNTWYMVIRLFDWDIIIQGHEDGVERYADTLDEALEQIIWVYKRHLREIGWRDRQTLQEQGYYAWEKEVAKVN